MYRLIVNSFGCLGEKSLYLNVVSAHDVGQQEQDITLQAVTSDDQIILADLLPFGVHRPSANWHLKHVVANLFKTCVPELGNVTSIFDDLEGPPHLLAGLPEEGTPSA